MSDPGSRPAGDGGAKPPEHVVEIELEGPGAEATAPHHATEGVEPNWRKIAGVSSIAGVALGLVAAVIIVTADDDDPTPPDEERAIDGSTLTTPETLPPVVVDTTVPATAPIIAGAPHLPLERPAYPTTSLPSDVLDRFTLDADTIARNVADRVEIEVTTEDGFDPALVSIEHDRTNDRYLVVYDDRGPVQRILVDPDEGVFLMERTRDRGRWQVAGGPNAAEMAVDLFHTRLLSPVRAETLVAETAHADTAVVLEDGAVARRYTMTVQAFRIPEWTTGENGPPSPGGGHVFEAYVDERGRLALVQGTVVVDGIRRLIVYRFDHSAEVSIDLPELEPVED